MPVHKQAEVKAQEAAAAAARTDHPHVDTKAIPTEAGPGVRPDPHGDRLLAAAQAKAPNLTPEFIGQHKLTDASWIGVPRPDLAVLVVDEVLDSTLDRHFLPRAWASTFVAALGSVALSVTWQASGLAVALLIWTGPAR